MSIYVFSDLHGRYDLWEKICARVQPNDWLISLGDNIDRGPDGIKIWEEIRKREKCISIKGNHEAMAAAAIPILMTNNENKTTRLWFNNGGDITWESLKHKSGPELVEWFTYFDELEENYYFINEKEQTIILDHAGFTLGKENYSEPLWDRRHFYEVWPEENSDFDPATTFLIHGHTPVQYMYLKFGIHNEDKKDDWEIPCKGIEPPQKPNIVRYCDGHKFDIDLGSYASNRVALMNIDTFEVIYIE